METVNQTEQTQQKTASFEAALRGHPSAGTSTSFSGSTLMRGSCPSSIDSVSSNVDLVKLPWSGPEGNRTPGTLLDGQAPHRAGPTPRPSYHLLAIAMLTILVLIPPAYVLGTKAVTPSSQTVSPLSDTTSPTAVLTPVPQPAVITKVYAPSDYLYLSQRYFTDAQTLSQKRQQTDSDKKEIIGKLQQAIDTISEGISLYPKQSELWIQRANIYTAIQGIAPIAGKAAASDLEQVQKLSAHKETTPSLQGLELVRDEQANSRDVLVAAPDETTAPYADTKESSAFSGTATIPAGQTSLTIENIHVTDAGPIYVVPIRRPADQTSAVLSVVKKMSGSGFTVAIDNAERTDIPFQYWITQ